MSRSNRPPIPLILELVQRKVNNAKTSNGWSPTERLPRWERQHCLFLVSIVKHHCFNLLASQFRLATSTFENSILELHSRFYSRPQQPVLFWKRKQAGNRKDGRLMSRASQPRTDKSWKNVVWENFALIDTMVQMKMQLRVKGPLKGVKKDLGLL